MNKSLAAQLYDYDESINIHMHLILCNEIVFIFIHLFGWLIQKHCQLFNWLILIYAL